MLIPDPPSEEGMLTRRAVPRLSSRARGGCIPRHSRGHTSSERVVAKTPLAAAGPTEASGTNPTIPNPSAPHALHGRVEKLCDMEVVGWAWDPQIPDKRIWLELVDEHRILSVVSADEYRPYLLHLGCGDGRHGFKAPLIPELLLQESSVLSIRCADTGALMPGSPFVVTHRPDRSTAVPSPTNGAGRIKKIDLADACRRSEDDLAAPYAPLLKQPEKPDALRSILSKLSSGRRVRYNVSRGDVARYRVLRRLRTDDATELTLSLADRVRETATTASGFITDPMIAVWLSREDLRRRFRTTRQGRMSIRSACLVLVGPPCRGRPGSVLRIDQSDPGCDVGSGCCQRTFVGNGVYGTHACCLLLCLRL